MDLKSDTKQSQILIEDNNYWYYMQKVERRDMVKYKNQIKKSVAIPIKYLNIMFYFQRQRNLSVTKENENAGPEG